MRKLIYVIPLIAMLCVCGKANANQTEYYAKCTLEVAEDSKGLGTVYMLDSEDQQTMEAESSAWVSESYGQTSGDAPFSVYFTVADGYELANFTTGDGDVIVPTIVNEYSADQVGLCYITLTTFSTDKENPTAYNVFAHFAEKSAETEGELVSVSVTAADKFGTFMAPVETSLTDDFVAYYATGLEGDHLTLTTVEDRVVPAFTPVILENITIFDTTLETTYNKADLPDPLPDMSYGILTGCIEETTAPEGSYTLSTDTGETAKFEKVAGEATVEPYNCWMTAPDGFDADSYEISVETGVADILNDLKTGEIYSIDGSKLNSLQKGINIVNGKKVIVK